MKKSYLIAFAIAVVAVLWIASNYVLPGGGDEPERVMEQSNTTQEDKGPMRVQVKTISPQNYAETITANGRSSASRNVTLRAEAEGQVVSIIAKEGDRIAEGDKIISIDVRERRERVSEARELLKQRKIEFEAAQKLIKQGYASDVRLAQTQSAYESAQASFKRAQIDLEKTTITAPFDGVLGKRYVDIGDYLSIGSEVTDIVDLDPLEVTAFVNEKEVVLLAVGNKAMLRFAGGQEREGEVSFIAPAADETSRTFEVEVEFENENNALPSGLTAEVEIVVDTQQAYEITPSTLTLNDAGDVGVKVVDQNNEVKFIPVTIIEDTPTTMWVSGLQGQNRIVTVGQDFIVPGQEVEAVEEDE